MPRVGTTRAYRYYADRYYLDRANRDTYLARNAAGDILLSGNLVLAATKTLDGVDLSVHAADEDAHHTKYTNAEAQAVADALIAIHAALPTVHQDAPALITTHAADDDAHHTKYTDAEAVAAIEAAHFKGARVYHDADQTIATASDTALAFNSERYDTDTIHDTVTNNSRLICKTAGKYLIIGMLAFDANATGIRCASIRLNGSTFINQVCVQNAGASTWVRPTAVAIYALGVNDYVELTAYQNSGGNLAVKSQANSTPEFMMQKIG